MAYAHVQSVDGFPATLSATLLGNVLIAAVFWTDSGDTNPTLTGFTAVGTAKATDGFNVSSRLFVRENVAAGVTSVAIASWDNGIPGTIFGFVTEYSGIATSASVIASHGASASGVGLGADAATSGNANATSQPALVYGVAMDLVFGASFATGTGFTSRHSSTGGRVEDKRITATGNVAATFTTSDDTAGVVWTVVLAEAGGGSTATATPGVGAVTLNGRTPATSSFQNVRIRQVLVNESGQPVGSAANITLLVWYGGVCHGAPDVSLNGMTSDANGTTSWSIATGTLGYQDKIFYVAQDSLSFSNYTCARLTPNYE